MSNSFFGTISFGRVAQPDPIEDQVLQRAEVKDYLDVAGILNAGVDLLRGMASVRVLYGPNLQLSESLKALVFIRSQPLK